MTSGSAADGAGLVPGDIIVNVNGVASDDATVLADAIRSAGAGHAITLRIRHNGTVVTRTATLSSHLA